MESAASASIPATAIPKGKSACMTLLLHACLGFTAVCFKMSYFPRRYSALVSVSKIVHDNHHLLLSVYPSVTIRCISIWPGVQCETFLNCACAGFFENKEADAKARGQKLPKKPDPKQEYDNFLKSIADDVQEVEARQDVEAVEAAQEKAEQEAFEHR